MMKRTAPDVPEKVRLNALAHGEAGRAWLDGLGEQVAEYERRWAVRVSGTCLGGTEGFVAAARLKDGGDAILKIVITGADPKRQELRTLRAAGGKGYVSLIEWDEDKNVLLLERLGRQLHEFGLSDEAVIARICATLEQAWMTQQPAGPPFATGADRAGEFKGVIERLWPSLGRPCEGRTFEMALGFAERRRAAFDPARSVLAHGDAHEWNTLAVPGRAEEFKLVDPDGAFAERAFDLSIPMREWPNGVPEDPLQHLRARCSLLARLTGVAPQPIWEWSLLQLVWNGLLLKEIGFERPARTEFAMADALSSAGETFAP
jgi:streptomycin 6-kinase